VKKPVLLGIVFGALVLGYLVISSFSGKRFHCEVCITFKDRRDCRKASAETQENALRTAVTNACAQLSSGVIESSQCENTRPESVKWLP
jgi:hypothetical protein